ncbi:MAG: efflux transporter outer membrane subunit, partial [Rhodospirillales bacterium]|nr:efflux transporter outer membrane subunit [Rhodospirillales bacterium]
MTPARFAVRSLAWAAAPWLLAGCTMGPNFQRPAPWWSPARFTAPAAPAVASQTVATPIDPHWWTLLGDPLLTSLEGRLDAGNLDLRVATLRLAEARAQLGVSRAALYPGVNGNASYLRQEASRKGVLALATAGTPGTGANGTGGRGATPNTSLFKPYDLYQAGFDASWEVDLWGRVARSVESARAQVSASADSRRDTMVTASAELARDYVDLRGAQRKLDITRQNLDIAKQNLQLTQARAAGGITTDLDVANAAAEMQTVAAQIPLLEARAASLMNAIAFLLGAPPHALEGELATARAVPPVPPLVPVGVPSDLLRRRPDIRRAEAQLHAATADIGVAVADFYPRFVLAGSGSLQSVQFHSLGDWAATAFSFGPSVSLPIFEGGRLTRTLELRK